MEEAVDIVAPSSARLEHAKALLAFGAALRHARRPTDARDPLRRALELAQELFVTPKTVERHLGNVYRKLGISNRHRLEAELAGASETTA